MRQDISVKRFRDLFRRHTAGIALIGVEGPDGPTGMTVNSLTPVSLDPPLLLFCAKRDSATAACIAAAGRFSVNLLAETQENASRRYAGGRDVPETWRWMRSDVTPWLNGANATFLCRLQTVHEAGDHKILIGEIESMFGPEPPLTPLIYHGGQYARPPFPRERASETNWDEFWWTG